MDIHSDPHTHCWQARKGDVVMGCCLDLDDLADKVSEIRTLTQVHGPLVLGDARFQEGAEADGLVSDLEDVALVVRTADCVPVHLTDSRRIAVIHAGWRGTEAGILAQIPLFFRTDHLQVVIGPAIACASYEVDKNLYGAWRTKDPRLDDWLHPSPNGGDKRLFNLKGFVRRQLLDLGVSEDRIALVPVCTYESPLPSYRREGEAAARIFNYVYRTPA